MRERRNKKKNKETTGGGRDEKENILRITMQGTRLSNGLQRKKSRKGKAI
jgi:hypothetical protein